MAIYPSNHLSIVPSGRIRRSGGIKEAIMADISKCLGEGCPDKERCVRYLEPAEPMWQSYGPFDFIRGEGECEHFWEVDEKDDE